jgi:hypothetical protein
MKSFRAWRKERVRLIEFGRAPDFPWYFRWTPSLGLGIPWPDTKDGRPRRLRAATHHGVQITTWQGARWVVTRQLLGHSTVKKEATFLE